MTRLAGVTLSRDSTRDRVKKVFGGRMCVHTGVYMPGVRWDTVGMACDLLVILWRGKRCVCGGGGRTQNGEKSWSRAVYY